MIASGMMGMIIEVINVAGECYPAYPAACDHAYPVIIFSDKIFYTVFISTQQIRPKSYGGDWVQASNLQFESGCALYTLS
jgi:hypothetical protein